VLLLVSLRSEVRGEKGEYAHVSYYFLSGLFGLVLGGDCVLLEAGIALADDSLDLCELARLLLYSHDVW
jgi:hypothetical protein